MIRSPRGDDTRSGDAGPRVDGGRWSRRARRARRGTGARRAGGRRPVRLGLPLLPGRHRDDRRSVDALPARPGSRGRRDDPRRRPGLPRGARRGDARCPLAGRRLRSLLRVPGRSRQRVREHQPDRRPRGRCAPAAAARPRRPGVPRRRSGPGARRADRAGLDRGPRRRTRPGGRRRARGRPRGGADRAGARAGGHRPRGLRAARRHAREPPRPWFGDGSGGARGRRRRRPRSGDPRVGGCRRARGRDRGDGRAGPRAACRRAGLATPGVSWSSASRRTPRRCAWATFP